MTEPSKKKRSQSTVPGPVGKAVEKAREVADGVEAHGAAISLKSATASEIRVLADELNRAETAFQAIRVRFSSELAPDLKETNRAAGTFIINAKKPISCVLGDTWNEGWVEVGFLQSHLRCPGKVVDRIALLDRMAIYLGDHPECEAPGQKITAARARELHQALSKADRALGLTETGRKEIRVTRDQAKKALRKLVADVIVEVRRKLTADSALWSAFGLDAPKPRAPRPRKAKPAKVAKNAASRGTVTAATSTTAAPASQVGLVS
jgi:hypothetical protein